MNTFTYIYVFTLLVIIFAALIAAGVDTLKIILNAQDCVQPKRTFLQMIKLFVKFEYVRLILLGFVLTGLVLMFLQIPNYLFN